MIGRGRARSVAICCRRAGSIRPGAGPQAVVIGVVPTAGAPKCPAQVPALVVLLEPSGQVVFDQVVLPDQVVATQVAPNRLAPVRFAPSSVADVRLAWKRLTQVRFAPLSVAP